jgi:hypothetical protein
MWTTATGQDLRAGVDNQHPQTRGGVTVISGTACVTAMVTLGGGLLASAGPRRVGLGGGGPIVLRR